MKDRIQRLQPAAQMARSREDTAAQKLAELQRYLARQQLHLQQLLDFRSEYAKQFKSAGHSGISARQLQDYAAFLANLDRSIEQSQRQLESLQGELQQKRDIWLMNRAKTQALEAVLQNHSRAQDRAEERHAQMENDERASHDRWRMNKG